MNNKPWENEPDFLEINQDNDYHLLVYRSHMGQLNGYVGVKRQHPCFGLHYDSKKVGDIQVHGGLTFSGKAIVPQMKKKYWYFGFDTAHYMDITPKLLEIEKFHGHDKSFESIGDLFSYGSTYKDINYVSNEVSNLYLQLKEVKDKNPNYRLNHKKEYRRLHKIKQQEKRRNDRWR